MGFFSAAPRPQPAPRYQAILFDVNETLLDMRPLKQAVVKAFGNKHAFHQWFGLLLQYSLVDTVSGQYHDFGTIGDAALDTELPPHKDAPKGLEMLLDAGYSLVAFTNSSQRVLDAQLRYADLIHYFEQGLSVEMVRRFKPDGRTYQAAVQHLCLAPAQALLIAAHGWDVAGAQRAGLAAGFIARPGQTRYPLAPPPAYCGKTLVEVARQLLGR